MSEVIEVATVESSVAVIPQKEVAVYQRRVFDFKNGMTLLPKAQQEIILAEYTENRNSFRKWLLSQLVEGIHYGFPPGCEAKLDNEGNTLIWNNRDGKYVKLNSKQWRLKPSLYKAGSQFIVDLCKVRAVFEPDMDTWQMTGSVAGIICRKCKIVDPESGNVLGEGSGAYTVGHKKMDVNAAIKMSEKNALNAAVINAFALSDLVTQDMEADNLKHTDPSMDSDFIVYVQEWLDELKIWPEYKVKPTEIKALRASLSIWVRGQIPNNAEAAMAWIRENVTPQIMHGKEGNATGLKFIVKRDAAKTEKADEREATEEWDSARSTLREWYDKAFAAGKKDDFANVILKVCKKPMRELKTIEDFKTAIKAVAELESEWQ